MQIIPRKYELFYKVGLDRPTLLPCSSLHLISITHDVIFCLQRMMQNCDNTLRGKARRKGNTPEKEDFKSADKWFAQNSVKLLQELWAIIPSEMVSHMTDTVRNLMPKEEMKTVWLHVSLDACKMVTCTFKLNLNV